MSMLDDVHAQPQQIGDALWRVEAADLPARDLAGGLVVCGMGGSAVGADLAAAALRGRQARPLRTVRGYEIEPWVGEHTLVLCSSYSGTTEETLSCFEAAGAAGAPRVALTTGGELAERARAEGVPVIGVPSGMQPRAAVVYMTVAALECAAACGAAPSVRPELEAAVSLLEDLIEDEEPMRAAEALRGTLPVVYGTGVSAVPAVRLKNQLNENTKLAAFTGEVPEICHNEIEGWAWGRRSAPLSAVLLSAPGTHPRLVKRLEVLRELIEGEGAPVVELAARGEDSVAQVLSLVLLGDLVSVHLADLLGVDAGAIPAITGFKQALG
jgi:glucose/mannose-6-phosphate isomerase